MVWACFQTAYTKHVSFFVIIQSISLQNSSQGGTWRLCGAFLGPRGNHGWSLGAFFGLGSRLLMLLGGLLELLGGSLGTLGTPRRALRGVRRANL